MDRNLGEAGLKIIQFLLNQSHNITLAKDGHQKHYTCIYKRCCSGPYETSDLIVQGCHCNIYTTISQVHHIINPIKNVPKIKPVLQSAAQLETEQV